MLYNMLIINILHILKGEDHKRYRMTSFYSNKSTRNSKIRSAKKYIRFQPWFWYDDRHAILVFDCFCSVCRWLARGHWLTGVARDLHRTLPATSPSLCDTRNIQEATHQCISWGSVEICFSRSNRLYYHCSLPCFHYWHSIWHSEYDWYRDYRQAMRMAAYSSRHGLVLCPFGNRIVEGDKIKWEIEYGRTGRWTESPCLRHFCHASCFFRFAGRSHAKSKWWSVIADVR